MHYYLTGKQARDIDRYTSETIGTPEIVLMERAALEVADVVTGEIEELRKFGPFPIVGNRKNCRILSVVGTGNNGGDAVAAARILMARGYYTYVYEVNPHGKKTESFLLQEKIARNMGVEFLETLPESASPEDVAELFENFDVIIDGIFGVGLTREITGIYKNVVEGINLVTGRTKDGEFLPQIAGVTDSYMTETSKMVIACDIPSGIDPDTGIIMGCAVKCYMTVTFGFIKRGMLINNGRIVSGRIVCRDIGLYTPENIEEAKTLFKGTAAYEYDIYDIRYRLPATVPDANKGTNGKILIIAGSKDVFGAMYLCTSACCRVGAGLVKVVTHERNRDLLMDKLPEVMTLTYDDSESERFDRRFMESVAWADTVLIGPGLGTDEKARKLLRSAVDALEEGQSLVLDADALNILSDMFSDTTFDDMGAKKFGARNIVLTPHIGEAVRLMKGLGREMSVGDIKKNPAEAAQWISKATGAVCILKDARTVVANPEDDSIIYINTTGNSGMAKGGSGDVLAGTTAGLLARITENTDLQKINDHGEQIAGSEENPSEGAERTAVYPMNPVYETACLAVNIHGRAGDRAKEHFGTTVMTAGNIIDELQIDRRR